MTIYSPLTIFLLCSNQSYQEINMVDRNYHILFPSPSNVLSISQPFNLGETCDLLWGCVVEWTMYVFIV